MFHDVRIQHLPCVDFFLQNRWSTKGGSRLLVAMGHLLRCFRWSHWLRCRWRNLDTSSQSSNYFVQPRMLRSWLVSDRTRFDIVYTDTILSVVFQWSVSYMISPDSANLGIKAVYVWAGLLVPFTILLWLYYPEVS